MEEILAVNFIHEAIDKDLTDRVYDHVQTRFPPEPNGYLAYRTCKGYMHRFRNG